MYTHRSVQYIKVLFVVMLNFCLTHVFCQSIRVMSFNILEGGKERLDTILYIINTQKADLVLIQESNNLDDTFAKKAASYGFQVVQNPVGQGILEPAIMSKFKIVTSESIFRMMSAVIELPNGKQIKVHNGHLLPYDQNPDRIYQMKHLVQQYLTTDREIYPLIVGGDLNVWSYQQEVLGQLTSQGFNLDIFDRLDYIYSFGLSKVPGTSKVLGSLSDPKWPSDHTILIVDYSYPVTYPTHSKSFNISNEYRKTVALKASDFVKNFPLGGLNEVVFKNLGTKGNLFKDNVPLVNNASVSVHDLDKLKYENIRPGFDEIEWLGLSSNGEARNSSYLKIENPITIKSFDRSKCLYDVDFLVPGTPLYFGSNDTFSSTSLDSLHGAEFVKFPVFIRHIGYPERADYFSLEISKPSTLYLAFDDRYIQPPAWITQTFIPTTIGFTSSEHLYRLYKRDVPAGKFSFGSNNWLNWEYRNTLDHFLLIVLPKKVVVGTENKLTPPEFFPNPWQQGFYLYFGNMINEATIEMLDTQGKSVLKKTCYSCESIFVETALSAGLYLIRVSADGNTVLFKTLKK